MKKVETFVITDHICRNCCGRILQRTGNYATGGGNPLYRCADCGQASAGISVSIICWCGFSFKHQLDNPFKCLPFEGNDHLKEIFAQTGYVDSNKAQVGVVSVESLREYERNKNEKAKT